MEGVMLKLKFQYFRTWCESQLTGKDPDAGKDWGQEEKGVTQDEMVGGTWLNGHEYEQALGTGDGQGGLVCCSPWGRIEWDTTESTGKEYKNWTTGKEYKKKYINYTLFK